MTRTALVLHGGGGPGTVAIITSHLESTFDVVAPTHPGWNNTNPVPGDTFSALAGRYLAQLRDDRARDVLLVGSSVGGWIAAEMAIQDARQSDADQMIGQVIVIDTVGADVPGAPLRDVFSLSPRELAEYAWSDPERGYMDPATLPAAQRSTMQGNMAALRSYAGGDHTNDPQLLGRLGTVAVPTLVVWGDADRMVTPEYGRAVAAALPNSGFVVIEKAGHLPHLEQPQATFEAIDAFVAAGKS